MNRPKDYSSVDDFSFEPTLDTETSHEEELENYPLELLPPEPATSTETVSPSVYIRTIPVVEKATNIGTYAELHPDGTVRVQAYPGQVLSRKEFEEQFQPYLGEESKPHPNQKMAVPAAPGLGAMFAGLFSWTPNGPSPFPPMPGALPSAFQDEKPADKDLLQRSRQKRTLDRIVGFEEEVAQCASMVKNLIKDPLYQGGLQEIKEKGDSTDFLCRMGWPKKSEEITLRNNMKALGNTLREMCSKAEFIKERSRVTGQEDVADESIQQYEDFLKKLQDDPDAQLLLDREGKSFSEVIGEMLSVIRKIFTRPEEVETAAPPIDSTPHP